MENKKHINSLIDKERQDILTTPALKDNPFSVPGGYFTELEDRLHAAIHTPEKTESSAFATLRTSVAMVAMFALVFGLGYSVLYITGTHFGQDPEQKVTASGNASYLYKKNTLSDEELLQYYGTYDAYSAETLETINVVTPQTDKDEIEQYLIDSNVPSFTILAALE